MQGKRLYRFSKRLARQRAKDTGRRGPSAAQWIDREWRQIAQEIDYSGRYQGPKGEEYHSAKKKRKVIKKRRQELKHRRNN